MGLKNSIKGALYGRKILKDMGKKEGVKSKWGGRQSVQVLLMAPESEDGPKIVGIEVINRSFTQHVSTSVMLRTDDVRALIGDLEAAIAEAEA